MSWFTATAPRLGRRQEVRAPHLSLSLVYHRGPVRRPKGVRRHRRRVQGTRQTSGSRRLIGASRALLQLSRLVGDGACSTGAC